MANLQKQIQQVAQSATAATVALVSDGGETGSGVIVSPQGLILTAAHVVGGDEMMRVVFSDGRVMKGRVLGANFTRDAAMVPDSWRRHLSSCGTGRVRRVARRRLRGGPGAFQGI